jgi:putative oxidoreductase
MDAGTTILRLTVGPLFIGHGTQKLLGWFDGAGLEGTGGSMEGLGLRPGRRHAIAAGAAETAGGTLVTLGFLTPVAAALLSGVMTTAIRKVHAKNGVWITKGGYEYNVVLLAALAALTDRGPGRPSLDAALLPRLRGPRLALASIGAGVAGSYLSERLFNEPAEESAPPQAAHAARAEPAAPTGDAFQPTDAIAEESAHARS